MGCLLCKKQVFWNLNHNQSCTQYSQFFVRLVVFEEIVNVIINIYQGVGFSQPIDNKFYWFLTAPL